MSGSDDQSAEQPPPSPPPAPPPQPPPAGSPHPVVKAIGGVRDELGRLEQLGDAGVERAEDRLRPIWQKASQGEHRLPVAAAIAVAIALQLALPNKLSMHPVLLLPFLESALLIGLVAANPKRIDRESRVLRTTSLALIAVITIDNVWSAGHLIRRLIDGTMGSSAAPLLASGASIYMTNVIVFGLWYWELDRGGPVSRLMGHNPYPDFLFSQMTNADLAPPDWRPTFVDYLYTSFTNAMAFSPTDVLPLTRWAKTLMAIQAGVALGTVALVVARAVNILK
jgi:hypothetical protein